MMTYLLIIDGATVNPTLVCLSEDRVEWFLHFDLGIGVSNFECRDESQTLYRIDFNCSTFQECRGKSETPRQYFKQ